MFEVSGTWSPDAAQDACREYVQKLPEAERLAIISDWKMYEKCGFLDNCILSYHMKLFAEKFKYSIELKDLVFECYRYYALKYMKGDVSANIAPQSLRTSRVGG